MERVISKRFKIIIGIIMLGFVAVIFYQSYAIFKESRKLRFIWGVVEDFEQTPDIVINVKVKYWDGTEYREREETKFPSKLTHEYRDMTCTNSGNAEFDENSWQMSIKNITEPTECTIKFVKLLTDEEKYGTSIPSPVVENGCSTPLYTEDGDISDLVSMSGPALGNCKYALRTSNLSQNKYILNTNPNANNFSLIYNGLNTYTIEESPLNAWISFLLVGHNNTTGASFTGFKLSFSDGKIVNIQEAVNQKYIEPLVLYAATALYPQFLWPVSESILTIGDSGGAVDYPLFSLAFKLTSKSKLNGVQLDSNKSYNAIYDGYMVNVLPDIDLSIVPFP